jgi:hypothetical protein
LGADADNGYQPKTGVARVDESAAQEECGKPRAISPPQPEAAPLSILKFSLVAATGGSIMSFDALTISGMLAALVSAGFIVGVVRNNGRQSESVVDCDRAEARGKQSAD